MRSALVVSEIAFACVLLVGAGLLIRSFLRVLDVNLGFQPEQRRRRSASIPIRSFTHQRAAELRISTRCCAACAQVPGVEAAGITDALPLGRNRSWGAGAKGPDLPEGQVPDAFVRIVSDGYIGAMGIPLRAGRDIAAARHARQPSP